MYPPSGSFALTDHTRKQVTNEDYRGKLMLIAFGYTYCPDICPTGLQDLSVVMDMLGKHADWVRPIFITVDPKRDTPEVLRVEEMAERIWHFINIQEALAKAK